MIPFRDDNPHTSFPALTIIFIVLNAAIFIFQILLAPKAEALFVYRFGMVPEFVSDPSRWVAELPLHPYATFVSSMFLHGGWLHLIGNMLYLWIFGDNVEHAMGRIRFLLFYLLTGLIAGLTHYVFNMNSEIPTIGASGAIAGVLGAYLHLFPHARIHTLVFFWYFVRVIDLPALFVLGFWFVLQLLEASLTRGGVGGVAYGAHIGGFAAGWLLVGLFCKKQYRLRINFKKPW